MLRFIQSSRSNIRTFSQLRSVILKDKQCHLAARRNIAINSTYRYLTSEAGTDNPSEWNRKLELPAPEFDWEYLCDERNLEEIKQNIENRKGVGDIHKVVSLVYLFVQVSY